MHILFFVFSDYIWLPLLELSIFIVYIRARMNDKSAKKREGGTGAQVKRGEKSWEYLLSFLALSFPIVGIIVSSDLIANYKIIVGLLNLSAFIYLCFYSVSFKNKIIGWWQRLRAMEQQV